MGDGKSASLCWAAFYHAQQNPGAHQAIVRDTWVSLRDTTFQEWCKWFPPGVVGDWKASERRWTWSIAGMEKCDVVFLGLDDANSAGKLQSRELAGIFYDEAAPASESGGIDEFVFTTSVTRLRQPGINWYALKIAQNSSDELHWTYRRFVDPGTKGYRYLNSKTAENQKNLPPEYYESLKDVFKDRPDLVRRFVDGDFGYQQIGISVTPEFGEKVHITQDLVGNKKRPLHLLWDWGLTPVCIVTQVDDLGRWLILDCVVGEDMGAYELVNHLVKPLLSHKYDGFHWDHIGDPAGDMRSQASIEQTAVRVIKREIGGRWRPGPTRIPERVEPLRWVLTQMRAGGPLVLVDAKYAKHVVHALRGGWHYHTSRGGVTSQDPVKNHPDSDVGDAMGYGAAILFPSGQLQKRKRKLKGYGGMSPWRGLGMERPGPVPKEMEKIEGTKVKSGKSIRSHKP